MVSEFLHFNFLSSPSIIGSKLCLCNTKRLDRRDLVTPFDTRFAWRCSLFCKVMKHIRRWMTRLVVNVLYGELSGTGESDDKIDKITNTWDYNQVSITFKLIFLIGRFAEGHLKCHNGHVTFCFVTLKPFVWLDTFRILATNNV